MISSNREKKKKEAATRAGAYARSTEESAAEFVNRAAKVARKSFLLEYSGARQMARIFYPQNRGNYFLDSMKRACRIINGPRATRSFEVTTMSDARRVGLIKKRVKDARRFGGSVEL